MAAKKKTTTYTLHEEGNLRTAQCTIMEDKKERVITAHFIPTQDGSWVRATWVDPEGKYAFSKNA